MKETTVTITCKTGLHLRPVSDLCNLAMSYPCQVTIVKGDKRINAKSALGMLAACIRYQDQITLICDGEGEEEAIETIAKSLASDYEAYHKE